MMYRRLAGTSAGPFVPFALNAGADRFFGLSPQLHLRRVIDLRTNPHVGGDRADSHRVRRGCHAPSTAILLGDEAARAY